MYSYVPVLSCVFPFTCTCTDIDCRLISGYLPVLRFPFCVVDSSVLTVTAYAFPFVVCRLVSCLVILGL